MTLEAPHEELEGFLNKERTLDLLSMMSEREREVLDLRYGISDGEKRTLAEIAGRLGVSRERVRQVEVGAIKKLREIFKKQESSSLEDEE